MNDARRPDPERISAWIDGEASSEAAGELARDPAARALAGELRRLGDALRDEPVPAVPERLLPEIRRRLDGAATTPRRTRPSRRVVAWRIIGTVAAGLAVAAVLWNVLEPRRDEPEPAASRIVAEETTVPEGTARQDETMDETFALDEPSPARRRAAPGPRPAAKEKGDAAPVPAPKAASLARRTGCASVEVLETSLALDARGVAPLEAAGASILATASGERFAVVPAADWPRFVEAARAIDSTFAAHRDPDRRNSACLAVRLAPREP